MNEPNPQPDDGLNALLARARAERPDTSRAEYGFETRLMARLRSARQPDSIWAAVSWRLSPLFAACVLALALWHSQVETDANDSTLVDSTENSDVVDFWNSVN